MPQQIGTYSGTYSKQFDIAEIVEEAYELAGIEIKSGYAAESARRSLNFLLLDWVNRGINLWTLERKTLDLVSGTSSYTLDSATSDIYDAVLRRSNTDTILNRISLDEYMQYPNKTTTGLPTVYAVERRRDRIVVYLWPVPNASTLDMVYYRIRYLQDIGGSAELADAPKRFIPALTYGLACQLVLKADQVNVDRFKILEMKYENLMRSATEEDREKTSMYIVPGYNE